MLSSFNELLKYNPLSSYSLRVSCIGLISNVPASCCAVLSFTYNLWQTQAIWLPLNNWKHLPCLLMASSLVSEAYLPDDEASCPSCTSQGHGWHLPLQPACGHVLGRGCSANTRDLPNPHWLLSDVVGQLYVHPPFTFIYIEDLKWDVHKILNF